MSDPKTSSTLVGAARGAIVWGAGATLAADVLQFCAMLVLVRILSPEDYGRFALAQAVLGVFGWASYKVFLGHALQARDPSSINWHTHFTAGVVLNLTLSALALLTSALMLLTERFSGASLPLAAMSLTLLLDVPNGLRQTMLQTSHNWSSYRAVTVGGAVVGAAASVGVASAGGGIWALVLGSLASGAVGACDLFLRAGWRPHWSWDRAELTEIGKFGLSRVGGASLSSVRQLAESGRLASNYDFSGFGVFNRSVGLATLGPGRIGQVVISSLYPVLTRADPGSKRFQRLAELALCGTVWLTASLGALMAITATDLVSVLYGEKWSGVAELLPTAVLQLSFGGINLAIYLVLLANGRSKACLAFDLFSFSINIVLIYAVIPFGLTIYLFSLSIQNATILVGLITTLCVTGGLRVRAVLSIFVPAATATAGALLVIFAGREYLPRSEVSLLRVAAEVLLFAVTYGAVLRVAFLRPLLAVLEVAPGQRYIRPLLLLSPLRSVPASGK